MAHRLKGRLRRGATPDTVTGNLRDAFGTEFLITGRRTADGYDLEAVSGPIPEGLRIPFVDDDAPV